MTAQEQWRPVVGYEQHYEVSDQGRVRRIGAATGARPGRVLKNQAASNGYQRIKLAVAGRNRDYSIHVLVLEAFVCPRPAGKEVNHINSDRKDNRIANLEWVTSSENKRHAHRYGLATVPRLKGEDNPRSKLTNAQVAEIRDRFCDATRLAAEYGVSRSTINRVLSGQTRSGSNLRNALADPTKTRST